MSRMTKGVLATVTGLAMIAGGVYLTRWGVKTIREELQIQGTGDAKSIDKQHRKNVADAAEAVRTASAREIGVWTFTHRRADGSIIERWAEHNSLSKIADQRMLENYYRGGAAAGTTFYLALSDSTNPCSVTKSDTLATAVTGEPSANGYTRSSNSMTKDSTGFPTSAASGNDWHIVTKTITITASGGSIGPVNCAVLTDVSSGTTGDWHAWAALSQARTMASGESLDVSLDVTLQ